MTSEYKVSILINMNWTEINLVIYIIAFSIGSMNIGLSILFHLRNNYEWTKYYLIFQISITFLLIIYAVRMFAGSILQYDSRSFTIITSWLLYVDIAFIVYFFPYFTTWIIAHPWKNPYKTFYFILSICFLVLTVLGTIFGFTRVILMFMIMIFFGDFIFCNMVILKNLKGIQNKDVRIISGLFVILSAFMLPFIIVDLFFSFKSLATMPIYYFWISLIVLIYLFNYFRCLPESSDTSLDEHKLLIYHITDREYEIIQLIRQGLMSKEISQKLQISTSTVNNHISNIYNKTNVSSRIELLNLLIR